MKISINEFTLLGNVGNIETSVLKSGTTMARVSLATTKSFKKQDDIYENITEWHSVTFFGRQAELLSERVEKGSKVYITGRIEPYKKQDQNGQNIYGINFVANDFWTDAMKKEGGQVPMNTAYSGSQAPNNYQAPAQNIEENEDVPF